MQPLDVTEGITEARKLLAVVEAPTPKSLRVVDLAEKDNGKMLVITFEGGRVIMVDRATRKPTSYDTIWKGDHRLWPAGEDKYERGLQDLLGVELRLSHWSSDGSYDYFVRGIETVGIPPLRMECVVTKSGEILEVSKISNMFSVEIESRDDLVGRDEAEKIARTVALRLGSKLINSGELGKLYYVRSSGLNQMPIRVRLSRKYSASSETRSYDIFVDTTTGNLEVARYR